MNNPLDNKKSKVAEREEEVLKYWRDRKIFEKTLNQTKKGKPFVFYDGPPFATGLPHYGHILTGTIKDVIPRYQTMRGRYVRREWGWDCHGLPLENIIEQELDLKHKKDIEEFGIGKFNSAAAKAVLRYEADWKETIPKTGRFVDMDNPYKTMDSKYTESVWWSFKTLYDKKLIYEGYKIMLICPRCETSLAQSEVAGSYQDVTDISVTVKFELTSSLDTDIPARLRLDEVQADGRMNANDTNSTNGEKIFLLAWTTTPWTLPGNTAIAVNPNIEYALIESKENDESKNGKFIVAKERIEFLKIKHSLIKTIKGKELVGKTYKPLFDYYAKTDIKNKENARPTRPNVSSGRTEHDESFGRGWKIYAGDFVTTETGTGIVHIAPAFGEDDMNLRNQFNLPFIQHVGMDGRMKDEMSHFRGLYVKQKGDTQSTDIEIIKHLAREGLLFAKEKIVHPYPLCWRCDTPLLNYATSSWFVKVTAIKKKLIKENKKITWVPSHIKEGRFGKWLEGAKDWAISRTRFWGAPLPVWRCDSCKKIKVIGGLKELKEGRSANNSYIAMRHGQSKSNVYGVNDSFGDPENHLTEKGREEVAYSLKALSKKGITRIVSSPLIRAKESAEIVAEKLGIPIEKIEVDKRFIEFNHSTECQGKKAGFPETDPSEREDFYLRHKDGENHDDVRARVMEGLFDLEKKYKGETILIVTHGSPMWMLISGAVHLSDKETLKYREDRKKDKGPYFISNAEVKPLNFTFFPHNSRFTLDFHRPYIDEVEFPCSCGGAMERIKDVFDCWFESGSMPYGQLHYPFENKKLFKENFPADFIAEGLDQTRGWFYSMLVLSVALFGKTPYRRVIVNGLILAEDGQKISKRLKNYSDVAEVIEKYGADSLRYYLLSSPVVRGEDVAFSEKGVAEIGRKIISRLDNVYVFYETYAHELKSEKSVAKTKNILDQWILARLGELRQDITSGMDKYELDTATRGIDKFVDDLSTWYLRRSRERFKGDNKEDKEYALSTTRCVLFELSKLIAPFMPFMAEDIYQKVKGEKNKESVHLELWPEARKVDKKLIEKMENTRHLVELALAARAENGIRVRQPLRSLKVKSEKLKEVYSELIKDEVNVKEIIGGVNLETEVEFDITITPELKKEGQLRELIRNIQDLRKKEKLTPHDIAVLLVQTSAHGREFIGEFESQLKKATLLKEISFGETDGGPINIDEFSFILKLEK